MTEAAVVAAGRPTPMADLGARRHVVLVTGDPAARGGLVRALRRRGWTVRMVPTVRLEPVRPGTEAGEVLDGALRLALTAERLIVTSPRGAAIVLGRLAAFGIDPATLRWAAVGDATARPLRAAGAGDVLLPRRADGASLAAAVLDDLALRRRPEATVVLARASAAAADLPERLRAAGVRVVEAVAYETQEGPERSRMPLALALADPHLAAIVFASGSAIRGLRRLATPDALARARRLPAVVVGPRTAAVARAEGFERVLVAAEPAAPSLARAVAAILSPVAS